MTDKREIMTDEEIADIEERWKCSNNMDIRTLLTALESSRTAHAAETAALERAAEMMNKNYDQCPEIQACHNPDASDTTCEQCWLKTYREVSGG